MELLIGFHCAYSLLVLSPDVSSIFIIIDKYVCTWCTRTYVVWCTQFEIIMMVYWFKIIWHFPSIWFPNLGGLKIGMICHSLQQNEIKNWFESFQRISNLSWKYLSPWSRSFTISSKKRSKVDIPNNLLRGSSISFLHKEMTVSTENRQ